MNIITNDDKFFFYIKETQNYLRNYEPISDYEMIFEAEDPVVAAKTKNNEQIMGNSESSIKKAINALIAMINKLFDAIGDFIDRLTMGKDERTQFDAYRQQMAQDPTLKNKKITVKDFRKINKEYDALIAEADSEIRKVRADEKHPIDGFINKCTGFLKNNAVSATTIVTADVALRMAESNVHIARGIRNILRNDKRVMEKLNNELGQKNSAKFEKRINAAAKNSMLTRMKLKLLNRRHENIQQDINATIESLKHGGFLNPITFMGKSAWKNENMKKVNNVIVKGAIGAGKTTIKNKITGKKNGGEYKPVKDYLFGGFKKNTNSQTDSQNDNSNDTEENSQ